MAKKDEDKPVLGVKSAHELYLERVSENDEPASALSASGYGANPNPFGDEAYAGTDPIYQNYAEDVHKPLNSEDGGYKAAEDQVREAHDGEDEVVDTGLGGKASKVGQAGVQSDRYLVPGQEGYKAPETGMPVRASDVEADDKKKSVTEPNNPGTNSGASVASPPAPDSVNQPDGVGDKPKK